MQLIKTIYLTHKNMSTNYRKTNVVQSLDLLIKIVQLEFYLYSTLRC